MIKDNSTLVFDCSSMNIYYCCLAFSTSLNIFPYLCFVNLATTHKQTLFRIVSFTSDVFYRFLGLLYTVKQKTFFSEGLKKLCCCLIYVSLQSFCFFSFSPDCLLHLHHFAIFDGFKNFFV